MCACTINQKGNNSALASAGSTILAGGTRDIKECTLPRSKFELVAGNRRIHFAGPGVDTSGYRLAGIESLLAKPIRDA
jgi:hypothetical protein